MELPAIRGMALCVNSRRCQSSYLPPPPDQKDPVLVQRRGGGKGKGVGVGLGGVKAEAGDSRLLACVVFPLRDLYTDVVGINF